MERYRQLSEELYIEPIETVSYTRKSFLTPVQEPERQNAKIKKSRNNAGKKRKPDQQPPSSMILEIILELSSEMDTIVGKMINNPVLL